MADLTVSGVPESITRRAYGEMIAGLGLDVHNLRDLEFRKDGIYAEVFVIDENGNRLVEAAGWDDGTFSAKPNDAATHRVFIRVIDQKDPP